MTLGEAGAQVGVTTWSNREGSERTVEAVEEVDSGTTVSFGDPDDVLGIAEVIHDEFGPIDVLVNNMAIRPSKPFKNLSLGD